MENRNVSLWINHSGKKSRTVSLWRNQSEKKSRSVSLWINQSENYVKFQMEKFFSNDDVFIGGIQKVTD